MTDGVSNRSLKAFNQSLREYLRYNKRAPGPLIENRARRVRWELFRRFKEIAPTRQKIEQEAAAVNYRIRRRRGADGQPLSIKKELMARKRSIRYLSVSFLYKAWRSRREGQSGGFDAVSRRNRKIGEALVRTARGQRRPSVELTSFLEGVVVQNRQRRIVDKALQAETANMGVYIRRKQQEALQRTIARLFS